MHGSLTLVHLGTDGKEEKFTQSTLGVAAVIGFVPGERFGVIVKPGRSVSARVTLAYDGINILTGLKMSHPTSSTVGYGLEPDRTLRVTEGQPHGNYGAMRLRKPRPGGQVVYGHLSVKITARIFSQDGNFLEEYAVYCARAADLGEVSADGRMIDGQLRFMPLNM